METTTNSSKLPRGLRNNNPGNIVRGKDNWYGMAAQQTDARFIQFTDVKYGYRALMIIIKNYILKAGKKTVAEIIDRWAPSNENNTKAYIRSVCSYMGVAEDYELKIDFHDMCLIAEAISSHENGVPAVRADVEAGWREAFT